MPLCTIGEHMPQELHTLESLFGGRAPAPKSTLVFQLGRSLTAEDLLRYQTTDLGIGTPSIVKLKESHHQLARTIAAGAGNAEASARTGYSPSRISILMNDPAFKELVEFYAKEQAMAFTDVTARAAGVAMDSLCELQRRLDESPETISTKDLTEVVKVTADRGGYAPVKRSESQLLVATPDELRRMKEQYERDKTGTVQTSQSLALGLGSSGEQPAIIDCLAETIEGNTSAGSLIPAQGGETTN